MGDPAAALTRAVEADRDYPRPYQPLVSLALQSGQWRRAEELAETLMRLDPYDSSAAYLRALAIYGDRRLPEAAAFLDSVLSPGSPQSDPRLHLLRAWVWADQGNLAEATTSLRAYMAPLDVDSPQRAQAEALLQSWTSPAPDDGPSQ